MNMLKNQTLDEIKIDREFIRDLEKDKSRIIIRNTIAMLQQLGAHIVIEGVETEEHIQGARPQSDWIFSEKSPDCGFCLGTIPKIRK